MRNYTRIDTRPIKEYHGQLHHFLHDKSGASIIALQNQDEENFFCFGFSTPPHNSHGTAHILEHTVLCGSQNYQVKDPFLLLLRGSMQSFLNAMTYPDRTLYPAASPIEKDFFNLMGVYGDAVFFPLLKQESFWQEGHRLIFSDGKLKHSGVVFNEMKGVYSSHENFASDSVSRSLFPDTCYSFDSGGDPMAIPGITWTELKEFHERYYHPSNARIFLYGDIDLEKKLTFLDEKFLSHFTRGHKAHLSCDLPNFAKRVHVVEQFPASPGDASLSTVALSWRLPAVAEKSIFYPLETLNHLLLGSSGAPFYFALQNSHLGEDVSPISGMTLDFSHAFFTAALRQVPQENEEKVAPLIDECLAKIVQEGIPAKDVESALRGVEFSRREIRSGSVGLRLARRLYRIWQYQDNPLDIFFFEESFSQFQDQAKQSGYFESLIQKFLIDNNNSALVKVRPDFALFQQNKQKEEASLSELLSQMSAQDKQKIEDQEQQLHAYQEQEDATGIVPVLHRCDIPKDVVRIENEYKMMAQGQQVLAVPALSHGIYYWKLIFSLNHLEHDEYVFLPLFCRALGGIGWQGVPYDQASREIVCAASSFSFGLDSSTSVDGAVKLSLIVTLKALPSQRESSLDVLMKTLQTPDFNVPERLKEILLEFLNDSKSHVVQSGSSFVGIGLCELFSTSGAIDEKWHGLTQLFFLQKMLLQWDTSQQHCHEFISKCAQLHAKIFTQSNLHISVATDKELIQDACTRICARTVDLPHLADQENLAQNFRHAHLKNRGYVGASQISFVGLAVSCAQYGSKEGAYQQLLAHYLTSGPLWEAIRMKGGAYGVQAHYIGLERAFTIISYRDPHVSETLDVYRHILNATLDISEHELDQALISLIGREIRPMSVEEKLNIVTRRRMLNINYQLRQSIRDALLSVRHRDLQQALSQLNTGLSQQSLRIAIGPKNMIESAQQRDLLDEVIELP